MTETHIGDSVLVNSRPENSSLSLQENMAMIFGPPRKLQLPLDRDELETSFDNLHSIATEHFVGSVFDADEVCRVKHMLVTTSLKWLNTVIGGPFLQDELELDLKYETVHDNRLCIVWTIVHKPSGTKIICRHENQKEREIQESANESALPKPATSVDDSQKTNRE